FYWGELGGAAALPTLFSFQDHRHRPLGHPSALRIRREFAQLRCSGCRRKMPLRSVISGGIARPRLGRNLRPPCVIASVIAVDRVANLAVCYCIARCDQQCRLLELSRRSCEDPPSHRRIHLTLLRVARDSPWRATRANLDF